MERRDFLKTVIGATVGTVVLPKIAVAETVIAPPIAAPGTMYVGQAYPGIPRGLVWLMNNPDKINGSNIRRTL